jgi:thiamine pyrophosphate-dependent acetolactate synthase large subunit-like protein
MSQAGRVAAVFEVAQFRRAIGDGTFGWLSQEQATAVYAVYVLIYEINNRAQGLTSVEHTGRRNELSNQITQLQQATRAAIQAALKALRDQRPTSLPTSSRRSPRCKCARWATAP